MPKFLKVKVVVIVGGNDLWVLGVRGHIGFGGWEGQVYGWSVHPTLWSYMEIEALKTRFDLLQKNTTYRAFLEFVDVERKKMALDTSRWLAVLKICSML